VARPALHRDRMAKKQKKAIQRHEVFITRGYICTLPKRGVERGERVDHYGIRYKPIERLWAPLMRELQTELGDRKVGFPRPCEHSHACVECGKEFYNAWEHGRGDVGKVCSNICQAKRRSRERESNRGKRPAVPS
jgi:hypothetical protein